MDLLVTNFSKNIINKPIREVEFFKDKRLKIDDLGQLEVNECIWYHIFEVRPMMRNIPANKDWFKSVIIHKR